MPVASILDACERVNGTLDAEVDDNEALASPTSVDRPRIERAVREILLAVGENPDREGLSETPARVARMYCELFAGLHQDPRGICGSSSRKPATRSCSCATSVSTVCASITCFRSWALPTSPTCRAIE